MGALALAATVAAGAEEPGEKLFFSYCAACHRYDGQEMGEAPPLEEAEWVTGPESRLIRIVMHGLTGRIVVRGETHDREMPGFGEILDDEKLAELLSFVRRHFGEPSPAISVEAVKKVRQADSGRSRYWTVEELER